MSTPVGTDTPDEVISLSDKAAAGTDKKKPLSVLFVVHGFPPASVGGVEVYTRNLAIEAASRGIDVTVLYPDVKSTKHSFSFSSEIVDGFRLTGFHVPPGHIWTNIVSDEIDRAFAAFLTAYDFDIVHFHHIFHNLSLSMVEVAVKSAVPVAVTLHDFWFICPHAHLFVENNMSVCSGPETPGKCASCILMAGLLPGIDQADLERVIAFRHEYARRLLANVDLLFAPSRFVAETFDQHGFGGGRTVVAPLGIGKIVVQHSKHDRCPRFGYLGTIQPLKNVKMLLRAFSATRGEASLHIYGGGNEYWIKDLKDSISDPRIIYHGSYAFENLPEILADIDILVVPSLIESFCFTVRESLSAGIPVVAARTGGIPEIVKDGVNGFLFDPCDDGELTRILQSIVSDGDLLRKLNAKALPVMTIASDAIFIVSQYKMVINQPKLAKKEHLLGFNTDMINLRKGIGLKDLLKKMELEYFICKYGSKNRARFKVIKRRIKRKFKSLFSLSYEQRRSFYKLVSTQVEEALQVLRRRSSGNAGRRT